MTPAHTSTDRGEGMPLRPALKAEGSLDGVEALSPKSGAKVVSIAEPPSSLSTLDEERDQPSGTSRPRQYTASVSTRRLSGRPGMQSSSSSRLSLLSQGSVEETATSDTSKSEHGHGHKHHHHHHHEKLLTQVAEWLQAEKAKRAAKKANRKSGKGKENAQQGEGDTEKETMGAGFRPRTESQSSDSSAISLEKLQRILEDNMSSFGIDSLPLDTPVLGPRRHMSRRRSSARKLGGGGWASSDTEYHDGDMVVPTCDVVLDNSKTMSYSGGAPVLESSDQTVTMSTSRRAEKEKKAWLQFKGEIVRLAHTLRLKGWRRVPLERGGEIEVERLSGALTNAVYVVSPPKELPVANTHPKPHSPKPPPKLLLRIYGPQVEHLIDRENELGILRRLARKKIGPRLLGTFTNGRFEEFFEAQTLKAEDLRVEDTMKQIAKRMRELHEGIDLLDREREEGPFVWRNWDKWVDRCEEVITYLDGEILSGRQGKGKGEGWRERGLVCGVEWKVFKDAVDRYRRWLNEYYRKRGGVESRLVFAHNDLQYGNILRLIPPTNPSSDGTAPPPSPLLLPQNHHKQLIVIDFEYASANTPGLEFANHFTEWCYNYHDADSPESCHTSRYPSLEQQKAFIRSYVNHRPQFNPRASATPKLMAMDGNITGTGGMRGGVSEFLLDSRAPGGGGASSSSSNLTQDFQAQRSPPALQSQASFASSSDFAEQDRQREADAEQQVQFLLEETHIWRVANSAQWVAWGIVQAKLPRDCPGTSSSPSPSSPDSSPTEFEDGEGEGKDKRPEGVVAEVLSNGESAKEAEAEGEGEDDDAFDYLAYARERALFFWGDVVALGIVGREELPEGLLRGGLKRVEY